MDLASRLTTIDDALCVSYPKSGRTLLRVLLNELGYDMEFDHIGTGEGKRDVGAKWSLTPHRRMLERYPKQVLLYRDPRDVAVSSFYQFTKRSKYRLEWRLLIWLEGRTPPGEINAFVRHPRHGLEKVATFNIALAQYIAQRGQSCAISYDDLVLNRAAVIERFFGFVALEMPDSDKLQAAVRATDFDTMAKKEASGAYAADYGAILAPTKPDDRNSYKVRRGKIGGYVDELDAETVEWCAARLAALGYEEQMAEALEKLTQAG